MGRVLKLMGAESGEESSFSLLLIQSVLLGIFIGALNTGAYSVFLSLFDETMMARGFVLSGLSGITLTMLYSRLRAKAGFKTLQTAALAFISAVTFSASLLLVAFPSDWIIWLLFIVAGPFNLIAILCLHENASKLPARKQGKKVTGPADAGLLTGIIIVSFSIPALLSMNFRPLNIMFISAAAGVAATILQILTGTSSQFNAGNISAEAATTNPQVSLKSLLPKERSARLILVFMTLSVMASVFILYPLMAVARVQFSSVSDLASFLGFFTAIMMLAALIVKLFVFPFIVRNYGLRTTLSITPLLVAFLAIIAATAGFIIDYAPAAGTGFILYFIILALNLFISTLLRGSVEYPARKILELASGDNHMFYVQPSEAARVNETAVLFSGLTLTGLGLISFVKLEHFSVVLVLIAFLWLLAALRLYSGFRDLLRNEVKSGNTDQSGPHDFQMKFRKSRFSAILDFKNDYFSIISGKFDCLANRAPQYYNILIEAAEYEKDINLVPALKKAAYHTSSDEALRHRLRNAAESIELFSVSHEQKDDFLFNANNILAGARVPQTTLILKLLRDKSLSSKKLAVLMIGKFRMKEMIPELCECLNMPVLEQLTANVLKSFGGEASEEIHRFSLISSGNLQISKTTLRLLSGNNTSVERTFLFERLWSASRVIKEFTLARLIGMGFIPSPEETLRLQQLITDTFGIIAWNLSAKVCLKKQGDTFLLQTIDKEISRWNNYLFNLLSVTYGPLNIKKIRDNIEKGSVENSGYALELIDLVIDEKLNAAIRIFIDDLPDEVKLRRLTGSAPAEIPEYSRLPEDILNRDYNLLGLWTRASVLRNLNEIGSGTLRETVIALLFNPETILQEEAAGLLERSGRDIYYDACSRLPQDSRDRIDRIAGGEAVRESRIYEKSKFLSSCFRGLEEEDLIPLAASLSFTEKSMKRTLPGKGGYILWDCTSGNSSIVYNPGIITELTYALPLEKLEEYCSHFPENAGIILDYIEKNQN